MENFEFPSMETETRMEYDLVCFSHLRWDFVYQRPQHLMSRLSGFYRVFFVEEPLFEAKKDHVRTARSENNVWVVTPMLRPGGDVLSVNRRVRGLVDQLFKEKNITQFIAWYYTPMALKFSAHLKPIVTIYDCMDELSAFRFAPVELKLLEAELFTKADVVFTGGYSLYKAKQKSHKNIHAFPSSIDKEHFMQARKPASEPADQASIPPVRLGFYGVLDERFDIGLLEEVARLRTQWQFVLLGPVVKISQEDLPRHQNIHYLGSKSYDELPAYLSGWDIALIPFEKNEATRYISPTKTPEYLAGGKPVISASIADVVEPYGVNGLVHIADDAMAFIEAAELILGMNDVTKNSWLEEVDIFLQDISWSKTVGDMHSLIKECILQKQDKKDASLKSVA